MGVRSYSEPPPNLLPVFSLDMASTSESRSVGAECLVDGVVDDLLQGVQRPVDAPAAPRRP
jgi:hypothetical protein